MRAYGIPRLYEAEWPDKVDIKIFGLNSRKGRQSGRSGEARSSFKNKQAKANSRRIWKKKERAKTNRQINKEKNEYMYDFYSIRDANIGKEKE